MTVAQHDRSLPSEKLQAIWIPPALKRQIRMIAAMEDRELRDVALEIVTAGLSHKQTPALALPQLTDPKRDYTVTE